MYKLEEDTMIATKEHMKDPLLVTSQSDCPVIIHLDLEDPTERREQPSEESHEESDLPFPTLSTTTVSQLVYVTFQVLLAILYFIPYENEIPLIDLWDTHAEIWFPVSVLTVFGAVVVYVSRHIRSGDLELRSCSIYLAWQSTSMAVTIGFMVFWNVSILWAIGFNGILLTPWFQRCTGCREVRPTDCLCTIILALSFVTGTHVWVCLAFVLASILMVIPIIYMVGYKAIFFIGSFFGIARLEEEYLQSVEAIEAKEETALAIQKEKLQYLESLDKKNEGVMKQHRNKACVIASLALVFFCLFIYGMISEP